MDSDGESGNSLPPFSAFMGSNVVSPVPVIHQSNGLLDRTNFASLDDLVDDDNQVDLQDATITRAPRRDSLNSSSEDEETVCAQMSHLSHDDDLENQPVKSLLFKGEQAAERVIRQCQETIVESFDGETLFDINNGIRLMDLAEMRRNFIFCLSTLKNTPTALVEAIDQVKGEDWAMPSIINSLSDLPYAKSLTQELALTALLSSLTCLGVDVTTTSIIPTDYSRAEELLLAVALVYSTCSDDRSFASHTEESAFHFVSNVKEMLKLWLITAEDLTTKVLWDPENLALLHFMICRVLLYRLDDSDSSGSDYGSLSGGLKSAMAKDTTAFKEFERFLLQFLPTISRNVQSLYRLSDLFLFGIESRNLTQCRGREELQRSITLVAKIQYVLANAILTGGMEAGKGVVLGEGMENATHLWNRISELLDNDGQFEICRIFFAVLLFQQNMECLYVLPKAVEISRGEDLIERLDVGINQLRRSRSVDAMKVQHVLFTIRERLNSQLKDKRQMFAD